jgi:gluconolactonase
MKLSNIQAMALLAAGTSMALGTFATAQTVGGGQAPYVAVDRPAVVTAIPGVVAAGARWKPVFSSVELQDGIVGSPDGGVLIAMQENDVVRKIEPDGATTIFLGGTEGAGALALDNDGRLFAVHRKEPTKLGQLAPERRVIARTLPDGKSVGRLSDLVVDLKGGFYMTGAGFFYINSQSVVSVLAPQLQTNGIALSPDGATLYVTNSTELVAFDLQPDGMPRNQRLFVNLNDTNADGMAVDNAGRVYVACATGVHVISPQGRELGIIPTARRGTSLAFSGPDKRTLYMLAVGANRTDGTMLNMTAGPNGRTLFKLPMLTQGFKGRPK